MDFVDVDALLIRQADVNFRASQRELTVSVSSGLWTHSSQELEAMRPNVTFTTVLERFHPSVVLQISWPARYSSVQRSKRIG